MKLHPFEPCSLQELSHTLEALGLSMDLELLNALHEQGLLMALLNEQFCTLHVLILAAYDQAARAPWYNGQAPQAPVMGAFEAWARELQEAMRIAHKEGTQGRGLRNLQRVRELVDDFMSAQSPLYGPLAQLVSMMRDDAIASWPAPARRWASFLLIEAKLEAMVDGEHEQAQAPTLQLQGLPPAARHRRTVEMPSLSSPAAKNLSNESESARATQPLGLKATPSAADAQPPAADAPAPEAVMGVASQPEAPEAPNATDAPPRPTLAQAQSTEPERAGLRVTAEIDAASLREELSLSAPTVAVQEQAASPDEPLIDEDEELEEGLAPASAPQASAEPFERPAQMTVRTLELNKRLEALRALDGKRPSAPTTSEASGAAQDPSVSAPTELDALTEVQADAKTEVHDEALSAGPDVVSDDELMLEEPSEVALELDEDALMIEPSGQSAASPPPLHAANLKAAAQEPPHDEAAAQQEDEPTVQVPAQEEDAEDDHKAQQRQLAERIRELNKKREQFLREQNWSGLVSLYEEGIGLFEDQEKIQIYLTLSKLYELKLGEPEGAFDNAAQVFTLISRPSDYLKHLVLVSRLGQAPALHERYERWLEQQLSQIEQADAWSLALITASAKLQVARQEPQKGMRQLVDFIIAHPERALSNSALLDELEGLSQDSAALNACYDLLLEQLKDEQRLFMVASFAGMSAVERDDDDAAMTYLWRAVKAQPQDEAAFHTLASVYEESQRWSQLVDLYDLRLSLEPEHPTLLTRRDDFLTRELEQTDEALARYDKRLKQDPDDLISLERLVRLYTEAGRVGEVYGFLSRHLEQTKTKHARAAVLYALARVAMEELEAPEEATIHLERVAELMQDDRPALEQLMAQSARYEIWSVILHVIEEVTRSNSLTLELAEQIQWYMLGAQAAAHAGRQLEQRRYLQNVLVLAPEHKEAQLALSQLS